MKVHIDRLLGNISISNLFPEAPTIYFVPEASRCCNCDLKVQKTRTRSPVTLEIGEFIAKETILICEECGNIYVPDDLPKIVPPLCNFAYDMIVFVGKEAFIHCRSDEEILQELEPRRISPSEIAYLQKKFIVYLALAHRQSSQRIREAMEARGGYILHLDGTCEGDSPHLMTGLDEITGFVLHNVKIPSESADNIVPLLEKIKEEYGTPVATISDMGKGIGNALKEVFAGVPHFLCHFHFLRDIGKDLLKKEYDIIRNRLKKHKITSKLRERARALKQIIDDNPKLIDTFHIGVENGQLPDCSFELAPVVSTYSLILWALDGKNQGEGYGFPFDRQYLTFVQRLRSLYVTLEKLRDIRLRAEWRDNRPFFKLFLDLKEVVADTALRQAVVEIESKIEVFDKFRDAMRITVDQQQRGLNDDGDNSTDIKTIEAGVKKFCVWLEDDARFQKNNDYQKMIKQIREHWKKLFADPITVDTAQGKVTFYPQRTNNILERFFREIKRGHCRKTGTRSMSKRFRAMLADTPLVKNLENEEYLKIILNGKASLEERFCEIDAKTVREELRKSQEWSERVPGKIRGLIKKADLPKIVTKLFVRRAAS